MTALVEGLRPAVQAEVAYALLRRCGQAGPSARQDLADHVQEVFVSLLANDGKALRSWDPKGGRSLTSFVRLVARRQVATALRSGRKNPWREAPTDSEVLESVPAQQEHAQRVESADLLARVLQCIYGRLDERGLLLFQMLYVEERSVEEAQASTGMTRDAVYAWKSRLKKMVRDIAPC
ncbi:MAG: sigma-70 family RNA polymerase sigma factor [Nannocystales bacterium]